ncbi:HEAT repeat domain-containing protein [Desulfatitalea alkaliphila]|uniref:HEAT repeat domain-containing protein n=1 Tax=Desulfatitalea alkaliphila TaxID=2929485 RepID=A0AA41QZG2_9BACT|nr:HEAT repeat domain-containing protein [Desulfatitalea alkaliphila]MCJ8499952.1 HEAT repeat domain-containing protein [Desulfatitalea alkaliphila]
MDVKKLLEMEPWQWPAETADLLRDLLGRKDADPEERLVAAELAGDYVVMCDGLAAALLTILNDARAPEALRATAAISLGPALENADLMGFDDPEDILISEAVYMAVQQTLQALCQDEQAPKEVRRRALEAAVRAPMDWQQDAVRKAYGAGDPEWRLTAVFCMAYVEGFEQEILEALQSEDPDIRYHAVQAAGNWELEAAWDEIVPLALSDRTDKTLRLAAIDAVIGIRPEEASLALTELMADMDEDIVAAVFEALAMHGILWDAEEDLEDMDDDDDDEVPPL